MLGYRWCKPSAWKVMHAARLHGGIMHWQMLQVGGSSWPSAAVGAGKSGLTQDIGFAALQQRLQKRRFEVALYCDGVKALKQVRNDRVLL